MLCGERCLPASEGFCSLDSELANVCNRSMKKRNIFCMSATDMNGLKVSGRELNFF